MCSCNPMLDNWRWKLIWKAKIPPKVISFTWTVLNEECLTQDNLIKRKIQFTHRCYMRKVEAESPGHLFTSDLWSMFLCIYGLKWITPHSLRKAYLSWCLWRVDKSIKHKWRMILACHFLEYFDRKE
uniref:Putative ovule protein n=1 Tax=Solanum chacoense TaxID=4108 RepID=A0A0V0IET7_SOLCH